MDATLRDADISLPGRAPLFLQGFAVLILSWAACWSLLHYIRAPVTIKGSIAGIASGKSFPFGPTFHLELNRPTGQRFDLYRLPGGCQEIGQWRSSCVKPEFPLGAQIEIDMESAVDSDRCLRRASRRLSLECTFSALDHISEIRVNGQPVQTGWSNHYNVPFLYFLVACAVWTLTFNRWRLRDVSWISIVVFLILMSGCSVVA
jgi:hypothetical protein